MPTFKITVAYDGTDYVGWQRQASGISIQGLLEDALFPFEARTIAVAGAGRTDAGVHAMGQVACFALERDIDRSTLVRAMNARLPAAVRVLAAEPVASTFHPRFDATAKTYCYRICTAEVVSPFEHRYVWHLPGPLDVAAMRDAAHTLCGEHDFESFRTAGGDADSSVRVLYESIVRDADGGVTYTVRGSGFLRHMVRGIVGTLVDIGKRRQPADWMRAVLAARDRRAAGATAPPQGLCLMRVSYGDHLAAQPSHS